MKKSRRVLFGVMGVTCVGSVACSAILGIDAPPAATDAGVPFPSFEGGAADSAPQTCAPLATGDVTYNSFALADGNWTFFNSGSVTGARTTIFAGGAFDGTYAYFAPRGTTVMRVDPKNFDVATGWSGIDLLSTGAGGFDGAVFDGRYVYFVPWQLKAVSVSTVARYDTTNPAGFGSLSSWSFFDVGSIGGPVDGGTNAGFIGGAWDGRFLYLVPHNNGAPFGRVTRYDSEYDASAAADAAEAGAFGTSAAWSDFEIASLSPTAVGYAGAVVDGTNIYFVPSINAAFGGAIHGGSNAQVARFHLDASFTSASNWTLFDTTGLNGLDDNFFGGAFDGTYLYLTAHGASGIATRYNTTATINTPASWQTYDMTRIAVSDAATIAYAGSAFDGRFVYYIPSNTNFGTLVRYDTLSPFNADCAWTTVDLTAGGVGDAAAQNFVGAVFDGQYIILIPNNNGVFARFNARTPSNPTAITTSQSGSFL